MKKISILIKGAIGNYNLGDDLLTLSICDYLNKIDIPNEITIISETNYLLKHIENINIERYYNLSGMYDILIYAGGTQFASFNNKKKKYNIFKRFLNNLKKSDIVLNKIKSVIFSKSFFKYKCLVFIGIGLGPFQKKNKYYFSTINLLKQSNLICVRDSLSTTICNENALSFINGSDLVFSLSDYFWNFYITNEKINIKSIGIIVRDWEYSKENASFIFKLKDIAHNNYKINFFSFCKNKDNFCINYLIENGISSTINIWDPESMNFQYFIKLISSNDLIITARYHGAIIASLINIPFISIGIEPKLKLVAEKFEMPSWEYPYDIEDCKAKIQIINQNYTQITKKMSIITKLEKSKNKIMIDTLSKLLKEL